MDVFEFRKKICLDMNNFNENNYFKEYPYFEKYNCNKVYKSYYFHDYGKYGTKRYILDLYEIHDINNKYDIKKYVIHKEDITDDDIEDLKEYCQCRECNDKIDYSDLCSCCSGLCLECYSGCIKSDFPSQININKARQNKYDYMDCD